MNDVKINLCFFDPKALDDIYAWEVKLQKHVVAKIDYWLDERGNHKMIIFLLKYNPDIFEHFEFIVCLNMDEVVRVFDKTISCNGYVNILFDRCEELFNHIDCNYNILYDNEKNLYFGSFNEDQLAISINVIKFFKLKLSSIKEQRMEKFVDGR